MNFLLNLLYVNLKHDYLVTTQPVQRVHKQIFATDYADVTD